MGFVGGIGLFIVKYTCVDYQFDRPLLRLIIAKILDLAGSGREFTKLSSVNPKPPDDDDAPVFELVPVAVVVVVTVDTGEEGWKD